MKRTMVFFIVASAMVVFISVAFTGYTRSYLDEETQTTFFIKAYPTLQLQFYDPFANEGNDLSLNQLSPRERRMFAEYCKYRFGIANDDTASLKICKDNTPPYL